MYSGCPGSTAWLCFEKPAEPLADSSVPSPCCCQGVGALPWFAGGLKPMQLYGAVCPRPIFAEVMEETRCATLVGSLNTVCDVWVVSRESSVNHIGVDVGSLAPSYDTISFDSLSSQQLRGAGLYPLPQGGILQPCQCTQQLFQCHHRASLEHRYPSLASFQPCRLPWLVGPRETLLLLPLIVAWARKTALVPVPNSGFMHSHFGFTTQPQTCTGIHYRGQSNSGAVGV